MFCAGYVCFRITLSLGLKVLHVFPFSAFLKICRTLRRSKEKITPQVSSGHQKPTPMNTFSGNSVFRELQNFLIPDLQRIRRRYLIFFVVVMMHVFLASVNAREVPVLTGRINDYASMISPEVRASIERKLRAFEDAESTQVVVLTVPSLEGEPIEKFSIKVAKTWKIGQKEKDNGVLLIVSKEDRRIRIEVGLGLEGRLTDLQAGRIIRDSIKPAFKNQDFDNGFIDGVDAIISSVKGEYKATSQQGTVTGNPDALAMHCSLKH